MAKRPVLINRNFLDIGIHNHVITNPKVHFLSPRDPHPVNIVPDEVKVKQKVIEEQVKTQITKKFVYVNTKLEIDWDD